MRSKRSATMLAAAAVALGACGSGTEDPLAGGDRVDLAAEVTTASSEAPPATIAANPTTTALPLPQPSVNAAEAPATGAANDTDQTAAPTAAAPADSTTSAPTAPAPTAAPATTPTTQAAPTTQATPAPVANRFPDVAVTDLASGQSVNLAAALGGGNRPVLLWFWSPF